MNKYSLILLVTLFGFQFVNCSSGEVKGDPNLALVNELNKQLEALEIEGFEGNKTTLGDKFYKAWEPKGISVLKEIIPKVPGGYVLKVTGHADPYGGEEAARKIADGRATHIRDRVAKTLGADGAKLETKNYGAQDYEQEKTQSISKNRRVEFQIYKQ
jgi:outer membrane protein OmpA-like peptidoglycan-associated protein